jgi:methionine biosynthesis protein MetW
MAETLQAVRKPGTVLEHMLRIAPRSIVTFPNVGHWRCRLELASAGRMPIARHLPHAWHDTPNIHLCTFADFEALCAERSLTIYDRKVVNAHYESTWAMNHWPNLFGTIAVYGLSRPGA